MLFHIDTDSCFETTVGPAGLSEASLSQAMNALAPAVARLGEARDRAEIGDLSFLNMPEERADLAAMADLAERFRLRCDDVLILGTGGSSLGGQTLYELVDRGYGPAKGAPRLHFMDNVDPDSFAAFLDSVDAARLGVLAISKSGGTAETLSQVLIALDYLRQTLGESGLKEAMAVITEPNCGPLKRLADRYDLPCLDHHEGIGGRYSVLTNVGLLPACLAGLDPLAIRAGAAQVLDGFLQPTVEVDASPVLGAALAVGLSRDKGINQSVLMPYVDRLACFAGWYRQLWAESLGKNGQGTTPIKAIGAVDQHSQLQLYLDGPRDKFFTLMRLETCGQGAPVPSDLADDLGLDYLSGRRLGDLIDAEAKATAATLISNGCPTRLFTFDRLDEEVMGGLFMHFMLETVLAAELFAVSPFGQPAVEEGKELTRQYMRDLHGEVTGDPGQANRSAEEQADLVKKELANSASNVIPLPL
ncbi:glucose-6-phosphate isomerase [Rhodovibrionaceae bacterium A322]